ncbi:hypothetical protein [Sorangium sp. So ce426]|uniref:hypothetical protein n=1 Tax=Sorangium sp. So ce426 TaxID=3133312 RepID=UPI003F5B12D9
MAHPTRGAVASETARGFWYVVSTNAWVGETTASTSSKRLSSASGPVVLPTPKRTSP